MRPRPLRGTRIGCPCAERRAAPIEKRAPRNSRSFRPCSSAQRATRRFQYHRPKTVARRIAAATPAGEGDSSHTLRVKLRVVTALCRTHSPCITRRTASGSSRRSRRASSWGWRSRCSRSPSGGSPRDQLSFWGPPVVVKLARPRDQAPTLSTSRSERVTNPSRSVTAAEEPRLMVVAVRCTKSGCALATARSLGHPRARCPWLRRRVRERFCRKRSAACSPEPLVARVLPPRRARPITWKRGQLVCRDFYEADARDSNRGPLHYERTTSEARPSTGGHGRPRNPGKQLIQSWRAETLEPACAVPRVPVLYPAGGRLCTRVRNSAVTGVHDRLPQRAEWARHECCKRTSARAPGRRESSIFLPIPNHLRILR